MGHLVPQCYPNTNNNFCIAIIVFQFPKLLLYFQLQAWSQSSICLWTLVSKVVYVFKGWPGVHCFVVVAKNLVLAGVKSVTLHDEESVELWDLSSNFYFSEADIGKNRALACVQKLQELNSAVLVSTITGALSKEQLSGFQVCFSRHISFSCIFVIHPHKLKWLLLLFTWCDGTMKKRWDSLRTYKLCAYVSVHNQTPEDFRMRLMSTR